jgi:hypothetical protein
VYALGAAHSALALSSVYALGAPHSTLSHSSVYALGAPHSALAHSSVYALGAAHSALAHSSVYALGAPHSTLAHSSVYALGASHRALAQTAITNLHPVLINVFFIFLWLQCYQPHCYCGNLLVYCSSPGAVGGMNDRGNGSTRRKPVPVPLCPAQITHDLTRDRTRAAGY